MKNFLATAFVMLVVPLAAAQGADDGLTRNGLAAFEQLRHRYYIGALYLPAPAETPENALSMPGPKRMDIRVVAEKWSPRRFSRQWNQLISINNPAEKQQKLSEEIIAFTSIPQDDLRAGDRMAIVLDPDEGTSVQLNGKTVLQTDDRDLFNLLLNCWVGLRPPSSTFKEHILNMPDGGKGADNLVVLFDAMAPTTARREKTAAWGSTTDKSESEPKPDSEPEPESKPEPEPQVAESAPPEKTEEERRREKEAERARRAEEERQRQAAIQRALEQAEAEARAEARRQKVMGEYSSKMVQASYQHVRYPKRALRLNQQGTVMLEVIVGRSGELLSVDILQTSDHSMLDKAAVKAVERTAPFPRMPEEIVEDSVKFTLPFTFQISG